MLPPNLYLGTSSWTAPSWAGPFYPQGLPSSEWLSHYSRRFRSVEIDATWYRIPSPRMVDGWNARTPDDFVFAAKVPQLITHEKVLLDCEEDLDAFVGVMRGLGPKLGALLLQFPYFKRAQVPDLDTFLARLVPFLRLLPDDVPFALEVRNKGWLQPALFETLRARNVALAWTDHPYMPVARQYARMPGSLTADFLYVRWLGDRYAIEEVTKTWDRLVYDRARPTALWAELLREIMPRLRRVMAYYNNHYAGCGYLSAALFEETWDRLTGGGAASEGTATVPGLPDPADPPQKSLFG